MIKPLIVLSVACSWAFLSVAAFSAQTVELKSLPDLSHENSMQHGAEAVLSTCLLCHSLKYIRYGHLKDIGLDEVKIGNYRGERSEHDSLLSAMDDAVRQAAYGIVPPDLSLMTKTRKHGQRYVYSLLTGFYTNEQGDTENHIFPGIRMPDALGYSYADDETARAKLEQQAYDIVTFLEWAADPKAQERHTLGYYVLGYLTVLTVMLYFLKRKVWRRLSKA